MRWVLRLITTGDDAHCLSPDLIEICRPEGLGDIANLGGVVAWIAAGDARPHPSSSSGDADGNWASQLRHAIQDVDGDTNFCASAFVLVESATHRRLSGLYRPIVVSTHFASAYSLQRLLPCDPAFCSNILQRCWSRWVGSVSSSLAWNRRMARWRHDNQRSSASRSVMAR